jgi:acetylornithine/N-succinyldiaminopimelate aminotransferase
MKHVFWNIGHKLTLPNIIKGEGCYLYDDNNKKYVDMESGVWCTPLGHCHPGVTQVIKAQAERIVHTGYCYSSAVVEAAAQGILSVTGLNNGSCVFLSSGSEAVEFGIQALHSISDKTKLLTLSDSFLGSYGSAKKSRSEEWFLFDWSPCTNCSKSAECDQSCTYLKNIPFDQVGAFVFEPGSSSGLVRFPPKALIQNIVKKIKKNNGFVQINEITTGIGRTGKWFGFQHYDLEPDIVSLGKGLGNGYPVSSVAMSKHVKKILDERSFYYQQSHQNDPLGCAVAKQVITIIREQGIIEKCRKSGYYLLKELLKIKDKNPIICDVRGRGLMIAVEFDSSLDISLMDKIWSLCLDQGYIIARRPGLRVFRIDPPLIIEKKVIDDFLEKFERVVRTFRRNNNS